MTSGTLASGTATSGIVTSGTATSGTVAAAAQFGVAAELAQLRRRAYGPEADIHLDPRALARLDELEHRSPPPADPAEAVRDAAGVRTAPHRWSIALAIVAVAAAACLAGVVVTLAVNDAHGSVSLRAQGPPDADLRLLVEPKLPATEQDGASLTSFGVYGNMSVVGAELPSGGRCLVVAIRNTFNNAAACAPPGMDVFTQMWVYSSTESSGMAYPEAPGMAVPAPVGTLVQYVWSASVVRVSIGQAPPGWFETTP